MAGHPREERSPKARKTREEERFDDFAGIVGHLAEGLLNHEVSLCPSYDPCTQQLSIALYKTTELLEPQPQVAAILHIEKIALKDGSMVSCEEACRLMRQQKNN